MKGSSSLTADDSADENQDTVGYRSTARPSRRHLSNHSPYRHPRYDGSRERSNNHYSTHKGQDYLDWSSSHKKCFESDYEEADSTYPTRPMRWISHGHSTSTGCDLRRSEISDYNKSRSCSPCKLCDNLCCKYQRRSPTLFSSTKEAHPKSWKTSTRSWKNIAPHQPCSACKPMARSPRYRPRSSSTKAKSCGRKGGICGESTRSLKDGRVNCDKFKSLIYPPPYKEDRPHAHCGDCAGGKTDAFKYPNKGCESQHLKDPSHLCSSKLKYKFEHEPFSTKCEKGDAANVPHMCPWDASITVNGTVRAHCNSTVDSIASKLTGLFRSSGKKMSRDSDAVKSPCSDAPQHLALMPLNNGSRMDFSRNSQNPQKHSTIFNDDCLKRKPRCPRKIRYDSPTDRLIFKRHPSDREADCEFECGSINDKDVSDYRWKCRLDSSGSEYGDYETAHSHDSSCNRRRTPKGIIRNGKKGMKKNQSNVWKSEMPQDWDHRNPTSIRLNVSPNSNMLTFAHAHSGSSEDEDTFECTYYNRGDSMRNREACKGGKECWCGQ